MVSAEEEPPKQADLSILIVLPAPSVTEILVTEPVPKQGDDTPLGRDLKVADGGPLIAPTRSADLTEAPPNDPPGPSRSAG